MNVYENMRTGAFLYISNLVLRFDDKPIPRQQIERGEIYKHCIEKRYIWSNTCMAGNVIQIAPDIHKFVKESLQTLTIVKES